MAEAELHLVKGEPTLEALVALYRKLTGRDPAPEDLEKLKAKMASDRSSGRKARGGDDG